MTFKTMTPERMTKIRQYVINHNNAWWGLTAGEQQAIVKELLNYVDELNAWHGKLWKILLAKDKEIAIRDLMEEK